MKDEAKPRQKTNRAASIALVFLFIGAMLAFVTVMPTANAATTTFYESRATANCNTGAGGEWSHPECWSLTSGGVGGAGVPNSVSHNVVFDCGDSSSSLGMNIGFSGAESFTIGDMTATLTGTCETGPPDFDGMNVWQGSGLSFHTFSETSLTKAFYFSGAGSSPLADVSFSGMISGAGGDDPCFFNAGSFGLCIQEVALSYNGPNAFGTMSKIGVVNVVATGKPIYCSPGCVDNGGNSGIIFGPAPATSGGGPVPSSPVFPTTAQIIAFDALVIALVAGGALFGSIIFGIARSLRPWLLVVFILGIAVWLVFSGVGF